MTIEEILAGESKNVEFKENVPEKSIKYMKSVVAFANGTGGKIIFGIADKTREVVGLTRKMYSKRWMRLPMPSRIAVNRQLFQILRCRQLMARRLLWQKFLKADSGHITLKRLDEREAYMSVLLEQPGLLTSI